MYIVFLGSDRVVTRDKINEYLDKNLPAGATMTIIDGDNYETGQVANALGASSLFGGEEWFLFDSPANIEEFKNEIAESLPALAESKNTFIILEDSLLAADRKKYQKYATEFIESEATKKDYFNAFSLAEALSQKDKRKLWVLLQEAKMAGMQNEEIVGILWWQIKSLKLASLTKSAQEAGMKEFPYNKAKRSLTKFSKADIDEMSRTLLKVYHDGHAGLRDLDTSLEEWALSL